jgi:hypothetical protein
MMLGGRSKTKEIQKYRNTEIQKYRNTEIQKYRNKTSGFYHLNIIFLSVDVSFDLPRAS